MQSIEKQGYTRQEILDQLHFKHGRNEIKFRYELLDRFEKRKSTLSNVLEGEVSMSAFAEIKRTGRFTIVDDNSIDWLNDRIQPFFMLKMFDGKWVEWSLGIFLLSTTKKTEQNHSTIREVEAFDGLVILRDDKFLTRYTIAAGTKYTDAARAILQSAGITKINIMENEITLKNAKEFEPGTEKLKAVNELLQEINWTTLWVDEQGYYASSRYVSPTARVAEYDYFDNEVSIINPGMEEELDLVNVANSWVVVATNPEEEPLISTYINDNSNSPTSTINRGRTIVDFREVESIANQQALDDYTKRIAFNASQVFGYLNFSSALNPLHSYSDVLNVRYKNLNIDDKYSETNWTMPLQAGAMMQHQVRRVVNI